LDPILADFSRYRSQENLRKKNCTYEIHYFVYIEPPLKKKSILLHPTESLTET